jgi:nucleotide-binding universal stress UspA family protein
MKILLPVDGSAHALQAVKHALDLVSQGLRADFVLVNVQPPATLYEVVVAHDPVVLDQVRGAAGADLIQPAEALLQAAGVEWEAEVASGDPAHLLLELIENYGCDAVIMGSSGAGSLRSALIGSVSGALLRNSPVPVTVVRQPEADGDTLP